MGREDRARRSTRRVVVAACVAATAFAALALALTGAPRDPVAVAVMAVVVFVAYAGPRRLVAGETGFNIGGLTVLATIPIAGGLSAAIVGLVSVVVTWGRFSAGLARAFNIANLVAMGSAGGLAFSLVVRDDGHQATLADVGGLALGLASALVVVVTSNAAFVAAVVAASEGTRFGTTLRELLTRMGPSYLTFAAVALLVDVLWLTVGLGPLAILLAAPFIWGVRWTTGQFADQNRTREWLVRAMHAALDERDPGAGRRSARIARWSAAIAEEAGLPVRTILQAQTTGALIEVERLTLPGRRGDGALSALIGLSFTTALTGADPDPDPRRVAGLAAEVVAHLDHGVPLGEHDLGAPASDLRLVSARDRALSRATGIDVETKR